MSSMAASALFECFRNNYAFTGCKAIGFNDDRQLLSAHIGFRRGDFGEVFVGGCWNVCDGEKVFTERFRAFS